MENQQTQQAPTTFSETMVINLGRQIDAMVKDFNTQMGSLVEKLNALEKENAELKIKLATQLDLPLDAAS